MHRTKGIVLAFISSATFGLIALFSIPLLKAGIHPPSILLYRSLLSALILGLVCLVRKKDMSISRKAALNLFVMGIFYTMTAMGLMYSYNYISSGITTTIHFLYPIVVATIMVVFYKEKLSMSVLFAAGLSLTGVALLCWTDSGFVSTRGLLAAFFTVFTYAIYVVNLNRPCLKELEPEVLTFYVLLFGGFIFSILAYSTTGIQLIQDPMLWLNMGGLVVFATLISALALVSAVKYAGPTITSILGSMEPVVATSVGILYFNEAFGWNSLLGLVLIISAVLLVVVTKKKASA